MAQVAVVLTPLAAGDRYKFRIQGPDGALHEKSDPVAFFSEDPDGTEHASRIAPPSDFPWTDGEYLAQRAERDPAATDIIYKFDMGSFLKPHADGTYPNYRDVAEALATEAKRLGYTQVEPLPIAESPFRGSRGYHVTGQFAPTARYGNPDDFRAFVNTLHEHGIGVINDAVLVHFPKDAFGLTRFDGTALFEHDNPLVAELPDWGSLYYDIEKPEVRSFLKSAAKRWVDKSPGGFHEDGNRFDGWAAGLYPGYSKNEFVDYTGHPDAAQFGYANYKYPFINFMRELNEGLTRADPNVRLGAEESTGFDVWGVGHTSKWDLGYANDTADFLEQPFEARNNEDVLQHLVQALTYANGKFIYPWSHDEVTHGKGSLYEKVPGTHAQKLAQLRLLKFHEAMMPGDKLNMAGNEFGQKAEWNEWDHRRTEDLRDAGHRGVLETTRSMNHLIQEEPALSKVTPWGFRKHNEEGKAVVTLYRKGPAMRTTSSWSKTGSPRTRDSSFPSPAWGPMRRLRTRTRSSSGGSTAATSAM